MTKIMTFSEKEFEILQKIIEFLENNNKVEIMNYMIQRKKAIEKLSESISQYPPILDSTDEISDIYENTENKIIDLVNSSRDNIQFNIPTKAVLGKTFLIAKINFFYLVYYFTGDIYCISEFKKNIQNFINENILILLVEEVFVEIIMDRSVGHFLKMHSVKLLFKIWEFRLSTDIKSLVPFLINVWEARKSFEPVYGTLMGTSEFFMLSNKVDEEVMNFLDNYTFEEDEEYCVQEFLFGLSYEEISELKEKMDKQQINVVKKDQIKVMLEKSQLHTGSAKEDPRDFYSFFIERKNNAIYRAQYNKKGPKKTFEEHIICYLLEKEL